MTLLTLPAGVMVQISGAIKDQMDAFQDIAMLLIISLILVYLIMASQFESLKMPFIIMFSIPFAFSGVAIALLFNKYGLKCYFRNRGGNAYRYSC